MDAVGIAKATLVQAYFVYEYDNRFISAMTTVDDANGVPQLTTMENVLPNLELDKTAVRRWQDVIDLDDHHDRLCELIDGVIVKKDQGDRGGGLMHGPRHAGTVRSLARVLRPVERHGFHGADEIAGSRRDDLLLPGHQGHGPVALQLADAVVVLARQQAQRKTDHAAVMAEHALDREVGLAGVGRAEDGGQPRARSANHAPNIR